MAKQYTTSEDDFADDVFSAALIESSEEIGEDLQILKQSDHIYAENLQFQEALMGSITSVSQIINKDVASSSSSFPSVTVQQSSPEEEEKCMEDKELGFCDICAEEKQGRRMFTTEGCTHSFCIDCMAKHVRTKIGERVINNITCPEMDCRKVLEVDTCRGVLPKEVTDLWEEALSEELISVSQRFYCPFKDCSAMLVNDNDGEEDKKTIIREAECPFCHRLFCAQCKVPWHSELGCEEFQELNEDERGREDIMALKLVREKKWSRCPQCKFYVERTDGCPHIICRCSFEFCYGCEAPWNNSHGGCSKS